jgi:hypothetical protein
MRDSFSVRGGWLWVLAIVMLGALAWGLEQIALTPIQTGDVYPPFSSMRSDPMGAKGLYESLAALPGITVERLYKRRQKLAGSNDAMFVLGVDPVAWSGLDPPTLRGFQRLIESGGRLVIAFLPVRTPTKLPKERMVETAWGLKLQYRTDKDDYTGGGIPHDTALFFETGPEWRKLVSDSNGAAMLIERNYGAGTIVLAADTYPLSNEGLRDARDTALIVKLAGPATRITFDEDHFGVTETGSVTALMRRYRLQGGVAILILVAALFLWRNATSLLPPHDSGDALASAKNAVAGRDSLEGLAALLHRGVPEKQLLETCFSEWSKSTNKSGSDERRAQRLHEAIATNAKSPVEAYRAACRILTEKT